MHIELNLSRMLLKLHVRFLKGEVLVIK